MKLKIQEENKGERLDKFLTKSLPDLSRSQIQKQIERGLILVNGEKKSVHYFLKDGDEIEVSKYQSIQCQNNEISGVKIIKEDKNFLIVNKPAGLVVHPAAGVKEKTLIEYIVEKYPKIEKVGQAGFSQRTGANRHCEMQNGSTHSMELTQNRPGIVHRLDKETSGLLVVARNKKMFEHLKKQFMERKIKKDYQALVYGVIEPDEGKITTPLKKNEKGLMVARSDDLRTGHRPVPTIQIKNATTEFKVIKRFMHYTLLEIILKTGRTHQIRAHLKSIGHPIVGDVLYKISSRKKAFVSRQEKDRQDLGRIFLHAEKLGFFDLNNNWLEFKSKLPQELNKFLKELKEA